MQLEGDMKEEIKTEISRKESRESSSRFHSYRGMEDVDRPPQPEGLQALPVDCFDTLPDGGVGEPAL
jgi:hypothetical protein